MADAEKPMTEWQRGPFTISVDKGRIDLAVVHNALTHTYWAEGIDAPTVQRAIDNALCFGVYNNSTQVGFARVITDYTRFAYLSDVFILDEYQGQGLGTWLIQVIIDYAPLQGVWRWMLATRDAHGLYAKVGFTELAEPSRWMVRTTSRPARPTDTNDKLQGHMHESEDRPS
jgi:GNAT superfamily N-acetyltransferase